MRQDQLNVTLVVPAGSEMEAARQIRAQASPEEWKILLHLATAVVQLHEVAGDPGCRVIVAPAAALVRVAAEAGIPLRE